jgi:hypothetical protein
MPSTTSSVGLEALGLLDRDHAVLADLLHRLGDDLADLVSLLAEMVPTWAISFLPLVGFESFLSSSSTAMAVDGLVDAALDLHRVVAGGDELAPSRKIACASTVAVVVPSPATSEVFDATSFTICAPMFSNLFSSSISLATVTPSLVIVGRRSSSR